MEHLLFRKELVLCFEQWFHHTVLPLLSLSKLIVALFHVLSVTLVALLQFGVQPFVLNFQITAPSLQSGNSLTNGVQIVLKLIFHLAGEVGAVDLDLIQLLLLFVAGEVEGEGIRKEVIDFAQEGRSDVLNTLQRRREIFLALLGV